MISKEYIENKIDNSPQEYKVFFKKYLILVVNVNNFIISGDAGVVDPRDFSLKKGLEIARNKIINKLWELEGYKQH